MDSSPNPDSLVIRLAEGLERLARVARTDLWAQAGAEGVNPVQAQVVALLTRRGAMRARDVAAELGVSAASLADTLAALDRKGMIIRRADPADARAALISVTEAGVALNQRLSASDSALTRALAALPRARQQALLAAEIALITQLQQAGAIPLQRLCLTCRYFTANAHPGSAQPHHCAFIGATIGETDLRLDCLDHESAPHALQAANWSAFETGMPSLQA